ncbi:uncharacterized protein [Onthophagus taurus]|uniref:uncharacterized protein n=1 Tax=Onthophagus taurus TaxID=166361 RepID=UPI0039BE6FFC
MLMKYFNNTYFLLCLLILLKSKRVLSQATTSVPSKHYMIENELCNYPCVDPWMFKDFYVNKSYAPCEKSLPLVYLEKIDGKVFAVINSTIKTTLLNFTCCIKNVYRVKEGGIPDNNIAESYCVQFDIEGRLELNNDVVKATCHKIEDHGFEHIYENVFGLFAPKNIKQKTLKVRDDPKSLSVLVFVVDSVSKQNFMRLMPETHDYLIDKGWIHFKAYNKVDKDSLGNALAFLTGYSEKLAFETFGNPTEKYFDDYPFIWNDYQKYGYVTAYAEDYSIMNTFNKDTKGFFQPPTDYYFRHFSVATERLNTTYLDNMPHCTGPENTGERVLNLAIDFAKTFQNYPYFGLFWINSFSHEDFNAFGRMDNKMVQFFSILEDLINNSIVLFMSDTGYIKTEITYTNLGSFESKMPFFYAYLPATFRNRFKDETENIEENASKLVSLFDVHATLHDILAISGTHVVKDVKSCPKCVSLFRYVPSIRSCSDAGIDEKWCNCYKNVSLLEGAVGRMDTASGAGTKTYGFLSVIIFLYFL